MKKKKKLESIKCDFFALPLEESHMITGGWKFIVTRAITGTPGCQDHPGEISSDDD